MTTTTPLRELYESVARNNGWSMRDVERRIKDRDHQLSRSRIGQILRAWPLESISLDVIRALAAGLGIAPERVAIAALQSMNLRVAVDDLTPAEAIARDETISEDTRRALLSILGAQERGRSA